ncbi:MAG: DUF6531 domain-containing protein [Pseudonocardiaceae bacterium]
MSDERVSARPANLAKFVAASRQINDEIKAKVAWFQGEYDLFQAGGYEYNAANPDLWADLATYQRNNVSDETFVETVRQAFVRADSHSPLVNARASTIQRNFDRAAKQTGATDTRRFAVTVDDPILTGRPPSSGFSDDPVCTATGHFLEEENDFSWPARLAVLRWRRTYSSRHIAAGPLGRGWSCWANARCTRDGDTITYHGPDGQVAVLTADPDGSWGPIPGLAARITAEDTGALLMAWRPASGRVGQLWRFDPDGLPQGITGADLGTTTFLHTGGLLTTIRHDGGRELQLDWDGARLAAVRSSCGRHATYRYDERGDLAGVQRPLGAVDYTVDEAGRILEVIDADGVRACVNTYDDEGRVLTQRSPFGRLTRFHYEPGGVTVVDDDQDGPVTTFTHDAIGRLIRLENDNGERLERVFDEHGNCVQEKNFSGAITVQAFDEHGNRVSETDPESGEHGWTYDERARVVRITGPGDYAIRFDYDGEESHPNRMWGDDGWELRFELAGGQPRRITDADGVTISFEHDADGNLVAVTDGLGHTTRYDWHPSGQLAEMRLPDGARVHAERDDAGWCQRLTSAAGYIWTFERSPAGRMLAVIEPGGARTELRRGDAGEITEMVDALGASVHLRYDQLQNLVGVTGPSEIEWRLGYDALGRLSTIQEPTGGLRRYSHDPEGHVVEDTGPDGHRLTRRFDRAGQDIEVVDRAGGVSSLDWDTSGRLVRRSFPDNTAVNLAWDRWDRPTSVTQPDGGTLTVTYTPGGRPQSITSAEGRMTTFAWDPAGRLAAITDELGHATRYRWDACGRLAEATFPSGRRELFGYDPDGRVVTHERNGRVWRTSLDHTGRPTGFTDPGGAVRSFTYDPRGALIAATDPLGHTTHIDYDAWSRPVAVTDPLGNVSRADYDAVGNVAAFTDPLGRTTRYDRDGEGRVTRVARPTGECIDLDRDGEGRITKVAVDGEILAEADFDARGRPITVREPAADHTHRLGWGSDGLLQRLDTDGRVLTWTHDLDGLLTARTTPGGATTTFTWDEASRLVTIIHPGTGPISVERDPDGRLIGLAADGLARRWQLDPDGEAVGYTQTANGETHTTELARDDAGRIVTRHNGAINHYRYDDAGQLVGADGPAGGWRWDYDACGRLAAEDGPDGIRHFHHDAAGQLMRIDGPDGSTTFDYDDTGRRIRQTSPADETTYVWDALDRLIGVERSSGSTRLDVDALGSLSDVDGIPVLWDLAGSVPELLAEGGEELIGLPGLPIAAAGPAGARWLSADWRGSTGPADPWGMGIDGTGPSTGGGLAVAGLSWLGHRCYDPLTRAFLSPDPLPGVPGQAVAANPYHYAANNPLNLLDPLGLRPLSMDEYQKIREERQTGLFDHIGNIAKDVGAAIVTGARYVAGGALVAVGFVGSLPVIGWPVHVVTGAAQAVATMANGDFNPSHIIRNAVNGPSTTFGLGLGLLGDAHLHYDNKTGMWVAAGSSFGSGRGGTTYGSTFVTPDPNPDERVLHHESIHSWQWAAFGGGIGFGIAYLTDEIFQPGDKNIWERQAGLEDGCYVKRPGCK